MTFAIIPITLALIVGTGAMRPAVTAAPTASRPAVTTQTRPAVRRLPVAAKRVRRAVRQVRKQATRPGFRTLRPPVAASKAPAAAASAPAVVVAAPAPARSETIQPVAPTPTATEPEARPVVTLPDVVQAAPAPEQAPTNPVPEPPPVVTRVVEPTPPPAPPAPPVVTVPEPPPLAVPAPPAPAGIDLVPTRIYVRTEARGLQRIVFEFKNAGTSGADFPGIVEYVVDGNTYQYSLPWIYESRSLSPLAPGAVIVGETNFLISDDAKTVTVTLDPEHTIPERDEQNNSLTTTLTAPRAPLPDLVVASAERQADGIVNINVKNIGDRAYDGDSIAWLGGGKLNVSVFERTPSGPRLVADGTVSLAGTIPADAGATTVALTVPATTPRYQGYGSCSLPLLPRGGSGYSVVMQANYAWNDANVGNNQFDF